MENERKTGILEKWSSLSKKEKGKTLGAAMLLLIGIMLMLYGGGEKEQPAAAEPTAAESHDDSLEKELEALLSGVKGAGTVSVLLRYDGSDSAVYAYDNHISDHTASDGGITSDRTAELSASGDGGVLIRTETPLVTGVLVVAEGAGDPLVKERLYQAVKALLGMKADQIAIIEGEGGE